MRISDWSSDVCSSDLLRARDRLHQTGLADDRVISGLGNLAIDRDIAAARFTEVYGNQWLTHITLTETQRNLLPELVGGLAGRVQRSRKGNRDLARPVELQLALIELVHPADADQNTVDRTDNTT